MAKTKAEIEQENREILRLARIRNYRIKRTAEWRCGDCGGLDGVLVVRVGKGTDDDSFATRCNRCRGDLPLAPGQLAEIQHEKEKED